jgi:hypothetical protein
MEKFVIFRHEEGICLNPREYLLDAPEPEGEWMTFESRQEAKEFLLSSGFDEDQIDNGVYIESLEEATKWEEQTS